MFSAFSAVLFMLGLGVVCGSILGIASKIFYVYEDPRISKIEGMLAGANCGGCGFAGCSAAAEAVVKGEAPPNVCIVAGPETATAVGEIMGMEVGSAEPKVSYNECTGGNRAPNRYVYMGVKSCKALNALYGGEKSCQVGCMGLGDCVRSCTFNAIKMGPKGYPVVDRDKCVGCGACERACPKSILEVTTLSQRLLHLNSFDDRIAPCKQTCPAEIDIPKYIGQIRDGDYEGAVITLKERNPLILSCGRVCPHPCEDYCRRGIEDEPVSINQLKRFVADLELGLDEHYPTPCAPSTGKRIAVIGGGPAGLSVAFFLRRLGHDVEIFEAMPKLGGMLRYGIPEYRLPKKTLDWEIQGILDLGIKSHTNLRLGVDFELGSLIAAGFDAVFLGVGAWNDYSLKVKGEDLEGCFTGISFLAKVGNDEPVKIGKKCAVIGGGNTAIDCVRTLVRKGAEKVYLVYRRTREEMPANEVEIVAAEHEGIEFVFLAAPTQVIGNDEGKVTQLEYLQMKLGEPDASGRRRPVPIEGSETTLDVDMVITAVGQSPDVSFTKAGKRWDDLKVTRWSTIDANPEVLQSSVHYIFTAGDSATGPSLVVEAIGGGRRAARAIHLYLTGQQVEPQPKSLYKKHIQETLFDSVEGIKKTPRVKMPELPVAERINTFDEVDLVISEEDAKHESSRCLNCCLTCYNKDVA